MPKKKKEKEKKGYQTGYCKLFFNLDSSYSLLRTKQGNEVTAKETSSSSSGKLSLSSEEHSSVSAPHVIPSSPVDNKLEVKEKPSG